MDSTHHHHAEHSHQIPEDHKAICPVTGDTVDIAVTENAGHVRVYNGRKVYFCCAGCVKVFDNKPENYIVKENH
ncbi:YHS domain-containing protein [Candidatus Saccharibacteria bacterium]|nr:YHS domain-containing protein [Candidatus Saccharibacteria bacterium]